MTRARALPRRLTIHLVFLLDYTRGTCSWVNTGSETEVHGGNIFAMTVPRRAISGFAASRTESVPNFPPTLPVRMVAPRTRILLLCTDDSVAEASSLRRIRYAYGWLHRYHLTAEWFVCAYPITGSQLNILTCWGVFQVYECHSGLVPRNLRGTTDICDDLNIERTWEVAG